MDDCGIRILDTVVIRLQLKQWLLHLAYERGESRREIHHWR